MTSWRSRIFSQDRAGCYEEREEEDKLDYGSMGITDVKENDYTDRKFGFGTRRGNVPPSRPRLSNKTMLKGLVERTECYNKTVDRKVMTDSRIAFEEEQLIGRKSHDNIAKELEHLAIANQHIPTKGRGNIFGRMRSVSSRNNFESRIFASEWHSNNKNDSNHTSHPSTERINVSHEKPPERVPVERTDPLTFQSPHRFTLASRISRPGHEKSTERHHFDPSTAYNGKVIPNYRYNYKPESAAAHMTPPILVASIRPGQRYPKRPESVIAASDQPKPLRHNYYEIKLYGNAQEERTAQRIQKTVRQTEAPPSLF